MSKNHEIRFKVSEEELKKIKDNANQLCSNVSSFCRMVALKTKIKVEL